jgi:light-regulated signal transduction histidine kinase (bacteriophytochrome)
MKTHASEPLQPSPQIEIERLHRDLTQAHAALEEFTYSVSHDLRASLRHVNAYVEIIEEELGSSISADLAAHLHTVSQAAQQMNRQIEGLTELSRLTRANLQLAKLDIDPLLRDVIATLGPTMAGRSVEWQLAPDFPALLADAVLIRQLLTHLLSNAIKFTRKCAPAKIAVTWQAPANGVCRLTVSDNGVGFDPRYTDQLFKVFKRLHSTRDFEGLGMGLALSRKIVERHGGAVSASGAPDAGCSVSFTLPLA